MTFEKIYSEMRARERKWPGFSNNIPIASIGHWHTRDMEAVNESVDLDHWIRQTDHDYPLPATKMFSPWTSLTVDENHLNWIEKQPDTHLQQEHLRNIPSAERGHIGHLISGGMEYGHDSGSSDVTKFLVDSYRKNRYSPDSFTRVPAYPGMNLSPINIDLKKIDGLLNQNKFSDTFHSFHGIGFDPAKVSEHSSLLHLPSYTSGSVNRVIALKWAKLSPVNGIHHVMHIVNPIGSHGLYIGNNPFKDNEVLLPRNITLKLHHSPQDFDVNGSKVKVWTGERQHHLET